jgi:mediator of RNA polymerase II transcription subunit 4
MSQPLSDTLLAPLNELQALAHTLFLSLSPPQSKPPPPPPLSAFLECDKSLARAINLVHVHQIKQRKIDALEAEILQLESQWRDICTQLAQGKTELEEIIEEGDERVKAIEEAKRGGLYPASERICRSF